MTTNISTVSSAQLVELLRLDGELDLRNPATAAAIVNLDVTDGLRPTFVPVGEPNIQLVNGYQPMAGNQLGVAAVPWTYQCLHAAALGQLDDEGLGLGAIPATNLTVDIEGVTLLRPDDDGIEIRRYVDWNLVLVQLGVTMSFRSGAIPTGDQSGQAQYEQTGS